MIFKKHIFSTKSIFLSSILFIFVFTSLLSATDTVKLILSVKKSNYASMEDAVRAVKGKVSFKYKYIDAIAVELPADKD